MIQLLKLLGIIDIDELIGLRPGEAINCVNAGLTEGGCGTTEKCRYCGVVNAILESQHSMQKVTKECNRKIFEWHSRFYKFC